MKKFRQKYCLSYREIADILGYAHTSSIYAVEAGKRKMGLRKTQKMTHYENSHGPSKIVYRPIKLTVPVSKPVSSRFDKWLEEELNPVIEEASRHGHHEYSLKKIKDDLREMIEEMRIASKDSALEDEIAEVYEKIADYESMLAVYYGQSRR